jgi:hypothetical protein
LRTISCVDATDDTTLDVTQPADDLELRSGEGWLSSFLSIMQVEPRLNVVTIAEARIFL